MELKASKKEMVLDDYQLEAMDSMLRNKHLSIEGIPTLSSCSHGSTPFKPF